MRYIKLFQSPRSGQICLNFKPYSKSSEANEVRTFQSPRSGQICLNDVDTKNIQAFKSECFNPLDRVKFV